MNHWADQEPKKGVVYLGINDDSREAESKVLAGQPGATIVKGAGTNQAMQGKTMAADGKTVLDLENKDDVARFLKESGVGAQRTGPDGQKERPEEAAKRVAALQELFLGKPDEKPVRGRKGINPKARDEMADFVRVLQQVEEGKLGMDRLIISGHCDGNKIYGAGGGVKLEQLQAMMDLFPKAQQGVDDLMLSACHTLENGRSNKDGSPYKSMFPGLESVWGYDGRSPDFRTGSPEHIRNWLGASAGGSSERIEDAAKGAHANATVRKFAP